MKSQRPDHDAFLPDREIDTTPAPADIDRRAFLMRSALGLAVSLVLC